MMDNFPLEELSGENAMPGRPRQRTAPARTPRDVIGSSATGTKQQVVAMNNTAKSLLLDGAGSASRYAAAGADQLGMKETPRKEARLTEDTVPDGRNTRHIPTAVLGDGCCGKKKNRIICPERSPRTAPTPAAICKSITGL